MKQSELTPISPYQNPFRYIVMIVTILLLAAMCSGCKATWHLKQAIKKDPSIALADTVTRIKVLPGVVSTLPVQVPIDQKPIEILTPDGIKVTYKLLRDTVMQTIECPPDSVITVEVPKVQVVEEELTEWQVIKRAGGMIFSSFMLGAVLTVVVYLYFRLLRK
jgi:uncharacterized protein YlzI (FlbEa/FlbD family)